MEKGLFIVFEGIDGCGKTTQIKNFVNYLFDKDKNNHIVFTRNPYKDLMIRQILREDDDAFSKAEKLAEMFINDREKHIKEVVKPSIEKGHHVISDRFKLSTIAYQSAQGLDMASLIERHEGMPVPDITFVIDLSPFLARQRMKNDSGRREHKFEANTEFLDRVRKNFILVKNILSNEKIFIVDGDRSEEKVFREIKDIFENELLQWKGKR